MTDFVAFFTIFDPSAFWVPEDSDISCFAVPSFAPDPPDTWGFGVAASDVEVEATSDAAINTASDTFFIFTFRGKDVLEISLNAQSLFYA